MKSFTALIAVTVVFACICVLGSAAVPLSEVQTGETWKPEAEMQDLAVTSPEVTNSLALFRTKRQSHMSLCRYCWNCCRNKGWGFCCRF
ncbi:hepcidin-1 [Clupea harengus]|uniref:Hepcidin-1 n=1 Tax=Clupea harengus TaxID=7950 RepID=A0A6P3VYM8_CLUHA|nr:hepcidin-1 [Clupea harengus]